MPVINNSVDSATEAEFKQLIEAHAAAWSNSINNRDAPARFFVPDDDIIYLDLVPPFAGYQGWQQFKESIPDTLKSATFTMHDDLQVKRKGNIAWTVGSFHIVLKFKDGKLIEGDARQTAIWEQRDGKWQIVHLHESTPIFDVEQVYRK